MISQQNTTKGIESSQSMLPALGQLDVAARSYEAATRLAPFTAKQLAHPTKGTLLTS